MLRPTLVTPAPALTLVTLAEAKAQCRVDDSNSDALITALIAAAESYLDGYSGIMGRALLEQTWEQKLSCFETRMALRVGIATAILSIHYFDAANVDQTLSPSVYQLLADEIGSYVTLNANQSWPGSYAREGAVTIQWKAGYGPAAVAVPQAIRQAMLLLVGHWYENREASIAGLSVAEVPITSNALLAPFRLGNV